MQIPTQTHELGSPVQVYPGSVWQVDKQPSVFAVFPSSQVSGTCIIPSEQTALLLVVVNSGALLCLLSVGALTKLAMK